jgi:hypothetical protein
LNGTTLRRVAAACLVAMWLYEELRIIIRGAESAVDAGPVCVTLFAVLFVTAWPIARNAHRMMIVAVLAISAAVAFHFEIPGTLVSGVQSAVVLSAFLAVMQMLRVALELSPGTATLRGEFSGLSEKEQHDSLVLRTHLMSAILGAGALAAVAPLHDPDASEPQRLGFAETALQGVGLAVLWSPFFVAMAVCTRLSRNLSLAAAVANGLAMACIGLSLSHLLYGGPFRLTALRALRRTAVEVAVLAVAIIAANRAFRIGSLEAAVIGIPAVSLWLVRDKLRNDGSAAFRRWYALLGSIAVEALVVGGAMVLAEVIRGLLANDIISVPQFAVAWPPPLLLSLVPALMLASSFVGVHPIISASCLLPMLAAVTRLDSMVAAASVLLGWMLCVVLSSFVVPVMFAANLFGVPSSKLASGRNMRFCALYLCIALAYLCAINAYTAMR